MPKGGRSRKNSSRSRKHGQKGGDAPASAWGYVLNTFGDLNTQLSNALTLSNNQNVATLNSTQVVPIKNVNANEPASLMLKQAGGRKGKGKKGGFLGIGAILEQAVVPFGLFGLQQSYGKSRRGKQSGNFKTRRHNK